MEALFQLSYSSTAYPKFSEQDLDNIVQASRTRNAALGVTGVLLFTEGAFLQVLEGPRTAVIAIFSSIESDPRHRNVTLLFERPVKERNFKGWAMGLQKPNRVGVAADIFEISRNAIEQRMTEARRTAVLALVKSFYEVSTGQGLDLPRGLPSNI